MNLDVWRWLHDTPPPDERVLSADERERALRYRVASAARQFSGTRAALRHVLARYLEVAPEEIAIVGDGAKPRLAGNELDFNVSHTAGLSLIAVAPAGSSVGIDVERVRPLPRARAIARRFFTPDEVAAIGDDEQEFLRRWTRKEALIKAQGAGVWDHLDRVATSDGEWRVLDVDAPIGFIAAAAAWAGEWEIRPCDLVEAMLK